MTTTEKIPYSTHETPESKNGSGSDLNGLEYQISTDLGREQAYHQLADPELRYKYVGNTERLIDRVISEKIDTVIFLDKSARPVAWLMRSLWPTLGIKDFDQDGQPIMAPKPDMKFVNIDREQWAPSMGRSEGKDGGITLKNVHKDTIDSLTGLFAKKIMDADEYVSADDETMFDGKNILIVDEVSSTGDTLHMAEALFGRAFANAKKIEGAYWMPPDTKLDKGSGGKKNADVPIWYVEHSALGRLVGDRSSASRWSKNITQRRGEQFLGTRFAKMDMLGVALRKEMQQIGRDVAEGVIPVKPGASRVDDELYSENFMNSVNGVTEAEYAKLVRQAEKEKVPFTTIFAEFKHDRQNR